METIAKERVYSEVEPWLKQWLGKQPESNSVIIRTLLLEYYRKSNINKVSLDGEFAEVTEVDVNSKTLTIVPSKELGSLINKDKFLINY